MAVIEEGLDRREDRVLDCRQNVRRGNGAGLIEEERTLLLLFEIGPDPACCECRRRDEDGSEE